MKESKEKLAVLIDAPGASVRSKPMGGMVAACLQLSGGTDLSPLLEGLPDDKCLCPHWGYLIKGSFRAIYVDGAEEVIKAGEVFYLPPGHTAIIDIDSEIIEFSPEAEHKRVINHILAKISG